ncbi:hypothetical protein [Flavobacterium sp.]|uniref:hypothetical protein n=1 Tax=Flavobacterium sp. TaxID=239 RepID=UPI0026361E33|nr:hypothetical protein [Flavobacterium sp.]
MMHPDTKELIENWEAKSAQINIENLDGLYNKFITVYTIYNRLYNESFSILKNENRLTKSRYGDTGRATILVVEFLGAQNIVDKFIERNQADLDGINNLLANNVFNINLEEGNPKTEMDNQLMINLKSVDVSIKSQAVLFLIYNVRNNIIHGYKDFQEYQRLIVEPLINLLESLIQLFKEKLQ